ncbi:MAG: zinc metalloprotease TldD [Acidilobus sp.]
MMEVLTEAQRLGAEFADVRYYAAKTMTITASETREIVNNYGLVGGYAVRALVKGNWGYFTTNGDVDSSSVRAAVQSAPSVQGNVKVVLLSPRSDRVTVQVKYPLNRGPEDVMIEARKLRDNVLAADQRIRAVTVSYSQVEVEKGYWSTDGRDIELKYSISRLSVTATAKEGEVVASAYVGASTYLGYAFEAFDVNQLVETLLRRLRGQLKGVTVKPGAYPVILGPEVSGVFAHEALGHLAEADDATEGILGRLRGKKIGREFVNVSDSPSLDNPMAIGITPYDDEGVEGREVKILEKGVVKEFMNNRAYAARLGDEPTGNGRAEDFRSSVLVRMRNTYFKPGDMTLDEMLREVREGYLLLSPLGGQTSPDGTFQFGIQEGYHVVNGEAREPIRGAGIAGYTIETIGNMDGVSKDFQVWPGVCGKWGQSVYVGTGGPYVRVSSLKVG